MILRIAVILASNAMMFLIFLFLFLRSCSSLFASVL
nr:MAG TPA: hypothetical protein [Caudoviricetes sp.]